MGAAAAVAATSRAAVCRLREDTGTAAAAVGGVAVLCEMKCP